MSEPMSEPDQTIGIRAGEELPAEVVERFVREHVAGVPGGPMEIREFAAGRSNLTYLLRIDGWEAVLRRQPLGPVPPRAHDMVREARLLEHMARVFPLAPRPYAVCEDAALIGVPFYVMERKHGVVLDASFPASIEVVPELCQRISETVVSTLVKLHGIDWRAAGLEAFGHPEGFLERQVRGWNERYERAKTDVIAEAEPLMRWLEVHVPASLAPTIVHNDFKLNNMLLDPTDLTRVTGVLDWEMTTIGDPLFDLAVTLSYWVTADDPPQLKLLMPTVTSTPGFANRGELMEAYARESGRDLGAMDFYLTFAYFKLAVIIQQIYARWQRGQTQDPRFAHFGQAVLGLIEYAAALAKL
jgi:aminoglycoside phosphotransferase (APT) family kinase protein